MPKLPAKLRSASNTNEIFEVLTSFCEEAEISHFTLTRPLTQEVVREVQLGSAGDATSTFKLGSLTVCVKWRSEQGEANPQSEMLVQMVVDALEEHLVRVGSELVIPLESERPSAEFTRSEAL